MHGPHGNNTAGQYGIQLSITAFHGSRMTYRAQLNSVRGKKGSGFINSSVDSSMILEVYDAFECPF